MSTQPLALQGMRVLDLGMFWAGPYAGKLLGDMGAEVIKIESLRRPDPLRIQARGLFPDGIPGEHQWNRSGMINERNRSKLGITLDLTNPRGVELFKALVKISDVVLENYSARVMPSLGLGYSQLKAVNPQIVMISISSQGLNGPEKDYVSFGNTMEQIGGMSYISSYLDEPPTYSSGAYPDAIAGMMATGAILAGLRQRRLTGEGLQIEISQREATTHFIGEAVLDYSMNGRVLTAMGNRHPFAAPHGCYPCKGNDRWVTIAVCADKDWQAMCRVMGQEELGADARFVDAVARYRNQDELDQIIEAWTRQLTHFDVMRLLQAAGVTAQAVVTVPELLEDPHLEERGFWETSTHPEAGTHRYYGRPMRFSRTPGTTRRPAPCFGEHNEYVLGEVLGLKQEELEQLERDEIIGKTPKAANLDPTA